MPKVFIKTKIPKFRNPTTHASVQATALIAEQIAKDSIMKNRRNGTKWPGLPFTSASVNDPPASQSGALASAIKSKVENKVGTRNIILFVDGRGAPTGLRNVKVTDYAATQEFGFPLKNVPPRPYLRPAVERALKNYKVKPEEFVDGKGVKRNFRFS